MYLVDASVLVYATDAAARQHDAARRWLDGELARGPRYVGLLCGRVAGPPGG
jgi:predicted nucleic acid-binding protein